jgi:serine/threonine protein kinase/tetratricopeptide (TPR) repeat protein
VCAVHGVARRSVAPQREPDAPATTVAGLEAGAQQRLGELGYELQSKLGQGGFGVVYAGRRADDGLELAVKVSLDSSEAAARALEREAAYMQTARGRHVPAVIWHGLLGSTPALVLERVGHATWAERLIERAGEPMTFEQITPLALGLLDAVEQIHRAGLVHLDLKPENVLSDDQGDTSIVDFGLARALAERRHSIPEGGGEPAGTAEYMSPEQCDDLDDLDVRSDVYSVGVLLYELISGAPPFWGKPVEVRDAQRIRRALPLPWRADLPIAIDAVVRGCLVKDRNQRCRGIHDLRRALHRALGSVTGTHPNPPQARPSQLPEATVTRGGRARATGVKEKRSVGLLFFESRSSLGALQGFVGANGGEIAQSKGAQYVVAFGHGVSSNPVKPALSVAHRLIGSDLASKVVVDMAPVTVEARADGTRRFFGAVLMKQDRFPTASDPTGVMLTQAAIEVLTELRFAAAAGRPDRFVLAQQAAGEGEATLTVTTFAMEGTTLVGRSELLRAITASARDAATEPKPTLFTVKGKSGYGRTHLASTVAESMPRWIPDSRVLRLAPQEDVLGLQGRVMPEMLRQLLDLPVNAEPSEAKALFCDRLGTEVGEEVWAAAAFTMGYLDARHPDVDRLAAAPGALRWAAARAAGEALKLRAKSAPQIVVLDDAHLVEDAVLDALEYATLKEGRAAIFACVLASDDFDERRSGFGTRAGARASAQLEPLGSEDAMLLARMLLHPVEHVPQTVLATLAERTQGIPRLLTELIRGLKREGMVRQNETGTLHYIATDVLDKLPDLPIVQWNARREIEALPPQLAGHASLASVLGVDFSIGEMDALAAALERAGMPESMQLDPSAGIARLVDAKILRRHRNGRFDFRHPLLRDTIYETLSADRRKPLHAAAFEVYEAATDLPAARRRPRLALHAARSGQTERAVQEYLILGQELLEAQAYLPAEAAFGAGLDCLSNSSDDARKVIAARGRGLMRFRLGRIEDAIGDLRLARERAHALGDPALEADIMLDEATVLDWRYKVEESAALVRAAEQLVRDPDPLLEVRLASNLTRVLHRADDPEGCVRVGAQAADKAAYLGAAGYESRVITLLMVAPDCGKLGRFEEAEQYFETIIRQAEEHSDLHHLAAAYVNRSTVWFTLDRLDRGVDDLHAATEIARKIGEPFVEAIALNNLAMVLYASGGQGGNDELAGEDEREANLQRASEHAARCTELSLQLWGEHSAQVMDAELLKARISNYRDEPEEAVRLAGSIRARQAAAAAAGVDPGEGWGLNADLLLEAIELATSVTAHGVEARWNAHAERVAAAELQPEDRLELLECRAVATLREGRNEPAQALYAEALRLACESQNLVSGRVLRNYARCFGA